jgi:glycosyltransferase involved in cell wall biosynthesis
MADLTLRGDGLSGDHLARPALKGSLSSIVSCPLVAYLSSYPPRECGIATFTRDLTDAIDAINPLSHHRSIIAINDSGNLYDYGPEVKWTLDRDDLESYVRVARQINASRIQVVSVQHEYGLFGGEYGEYLLTFLRLLERPVVLTMHTVLQNPKPKLRQVTEEMIRLSAAVVVQAQRARAILAQHYPGVNLEKVYFIPHGTPVLRRAPTSRFKKELGIADRTVLSTFGLLNPNKGIQYVIQALPAVIERHPDVLYLILGETHPDVRRQSGESYRNYLTQLVAELGLKDHVKFNNRYLGKVELLTYLRATDIYLMPYLHPDQIVSGTLAYAIACGKAVVATPFQHAQELLSGGRGVLVPFHDAWSFSVAINHLLDDPELKKRIEDNAYRYGRNMHWPKVARSYRRLFQQVAASGRTSQQEAAIAPTAPVAGFERLPEALLSPEPDTSLGLADAPLVQ